MSSLQRARIPASRVEEFARKVFALAEEFGEFEPVPGERVYAFLAAVFPSNQPELPEDEG
jgi:hypothetical protein